MINKPEWIEHYSCSWSDLVNTLGHAVMDHASFGSYQGDHVYVLKNKDTDDIGYLVIGYGSCSGCDALEDALPWGNESNWDNDNNWSKVISIRDGLHDKIYWEAPENRLMGNDWWQYEKELYDWLSKSYYNAKAIS